MQPLVSISCTTYNHEKYLSDALDSFLIQKTTFPFEIIVHDDASTDATRDIILAYHDKYPDIIKYIFQKENQYRKGGLIAPRFVFPQAKGKYIAICEGDDYWMDEHKLQKQVDFLEKNPEYVIVYTDCEAFNDKGLLDVNFGGALRDLEALELKKATPIYTLTTCFRNVITDISCDLYSARYGDLVIWSLLGHFGKGKYLGDIIRPSRYRVHDTGIHSKSSKRTKLEMGIMTYSALHAYYYRLGDYVLSDFYKGKVLMLTARSIGVTGIIKLLLQKLANRILPGRHI
jgi:glycosyltransferase involved in cell wall biosynthesis